LGGQCAAGRKAGAREVQLPLVAFSGSTSNCHRLAC
jgi:hypothetical protein